MSGKSNVQYGPHNLSPLACSCTDGLSVCGSRQGTHTQSAAVSTHASLTYVSLETEDRVWVQVDRFLEAVAAEDACVLVHCGGGKGRAGTFAACCLAMWGAPPSLDLTADKPVLSAQEAVRLVRSLRPGSIETQEQEAFVQACPHAAFHTDTQSVCVCVRCCVIG